MANDAKLAGNIIDVSEAPAASIFRAVDEDSSGDTPPITWHHITDKFNFQWHSPSAVRMKYYIQWIKCTALHPSTHIRTTSHSTAHKPAGSYRGADKSLARPGRKQDRKHVRDARDLNKIETRAVIKFLFLQGKAPKEMHAILTETLACFLPSRAKDLSAPLYTWL